MVIVKSCIHILSCVINNTGMCTVQSFIAIGINKLTNLVFGRF